jgi:hypothetical protein
MHAGKTVPPPPALSAIAGCVGCAPSMPPSTPAAPPDRAAALRRRRSLRHAQPRLPSLCCRAPLLCRLRWPGAHRNATLSCPKAGGGFRPQITGRAASASVCPIVSRTRRPTARAPGAAPASHHADTVDHPAPVTIAACVSHQAGRLPVPATDAQLRALPCTGTKVLPGAFPKIQVERDSQRQQRI